MSLKIETYASYIFSIETQLRNSKEYMHSKSTETFLKVFLFNF